MLKDFYSKYLMNQKMMRTVLIALTPLMIASVYFFGWRTLLLLLVVTIFGVGTEYIFEKMNKKKVSEAVLVTCMLYTMILPPATPYWIAVVGIIFGVMFGKSVFGGFGRNVFNPALVARAFVYVSFPAPLTIQWSKASMGFPGGFSTYLTEGVEAVSQATPMLIFKNTGTMVDYKNLLIGNISGSIGETSAILIILAGIYLIYKKVASWEIMAGTMLGFLSLTSILYFFTDANIANPLFGVLSGGFLFANVFMVTDPISGAKTKEGKWIYGVLIGLITVIIRTFSLFSGGVMFAILIANTFVPIIDEAVKGVKKRKKAKKEGVVA